MPGLSFNFSLEFEEYDCNGEKCSKCDKEIYGKGFIPMLQTSITEDAPKLIDVVYCKECKGEMDNNA